MRLINKIPFNIFKTKKKTKKKPKKKLKDY